jgi:methionine-rich copper-binding protein CopC
MRIIITTIALLIAAVGPAFAHAHLDHASPAVGSTVAQAPKEVVLWFTNELEPAFSSIEVRDEKGASMQAGKAGVDRGNRTQLRVPLKSLPPGTYKVIWRVLSVDTHRTQGDFTFRVGP